jgi:Sulfotransferase family
VRVIIINCFGRGGSSILWNMIGSSPDVIMTEKEWHQAVFGSSRRLRNLTTRTFWHLGISSIGLLQRRAHDALLAMRSAEDLRTKRDDASIVTKVMDYHIVFSSMIARAFDAVDYVVLTRHPFGQCESLMRSGLGLRAACRWYNDVAAAMSDTVEQRQGIVVRFEDLVEKPIAYCDRLYSRLGIAWRTDGRFRLKKKRFGEDRRGNGDFSENLFEWVGAENAAQCIDAGVARAAIGRLASHTRGEIWRRTRIAAQRLGYQEDPFAADDALNAHH